MPQPHNHEKENRNKREWTRLARLWTWAEKIETKLLGPAANLRSTLGPIRNQRMLDSNPDIEVVVAFDGGTGTADMKKRAKKAGIEVKEAAEYGYVDRG